MTNLDERNRKRGTAPSTIDPGGVLCAGFAGTVGAASGGEPTGLLAGDRHALEKVDRIEIRPPDSVEEYRRACLLVEAAYFEHGIAPNHRMNHPKAIFVAMRKGQVVGSVGLQSADQGPLPSEYYFGFDVETICHLPRTAVGEMVKLAARDRNDSTVFRALVAACLQYAFAEANFGAVVAIVKPKLEKAIHRLLHVPMWAPECQMVPGRAVVENPRYFLEEGCPRPICTVSRDFPVYGPALLGQVQRTAILDTRNFDHLRDYGEPSGYSPNRRRRVDREMALDAFGTSGTHQTSVPTLGGGAPVTVGEP